MMDWNRLRWKWRLFKQRLARAGEEVAPRARGPAAQLKACRECRALVPRSARTCPECGARLGWFAARGRGASSGLFAESPATGTLLLAIIGIFVARWALMALAPRGVGGAVWGRFPYTSDVFFTGEYWRLLTGVFLHGGIPHILFNSAALYALGREVESVYGWARTLLLFLGAGLAGSSSSVILSTSFFVGVGASGAIFGLIGAVGVFGYRRGGSFGRGVMRIAGQWAAYGLAFGFLAPLLGLGRVDNVAHVGGLLAGAALALVVPPERERPSPLWDAAGAAAAALVPLAFAWGLLSR